MPRVGYSRAVAVPNSDLDWVTFVLAALCVPFAFHGPQRRSPMPQLGQPVDHCRQHLIERPRVLQIEVGKAPAHLCE